MLRISREGDDYDRNGEKLGQKLKVFGRTIACMALMAFGLGFIGALHPIGDSLSVGRIPALLAALVLSPFATAWCGVNRVLFAGLLGVTAFGAAQFVPDSPKGGGFGVYQKNLSFRTRDPSKMVADIVESQASVVTLQEVPQTRQVALEQLKETHPAQHFCAFASVGGVAVLAKSNKVLQRFPCVPDDGFAAMQIELDGQAVWVVSIHLHWPFPYGQAAQVDRLVTHLKTLDGPILIGGDFNMMPWGHVVRKIERATGTHRAGHIMTTLELRDSYPLFIDHVLVSGFETLYAERRNKISSDHYGVLVTLAPNP